MWTRKFIISLVALAVGGTGYVGITVAQRGEEGDWTYKFSETVQVKMIGGVPRPQFALTDNQPALTSVGDTLAFSAELVGVDRRGNPVTGTMHGACTAAGVEERNVPACVARKPDGTCALTDPLAPLFVCQQVLRLDDPGRGVDGVSQLTIQGFVRQLEAAGEPPGQGQRSQWLAVTGGTGRFEGASGTVKYDLRENPAPPPLKDLEVYLRGRR